MNLATLVVVALAVLLVGGYAVGGVWNARRMRVLARGLANALTGPAGPPVVRRPGRGTIRLEAQSPFRGTGRVTATILMAPREALLVWLVWTAQGRGDLLDLRAELDAPPAGAGLIADATHRTGRAALRAAEDAGGTHRQAAGKMTIAAYDAQGIAVMSSIGPAIAEIGDVVLLELRGAQPRLTLLVSLRRAPGSFRSLRPGLEHLVEQARRGRT